MPIKRTNREIENYLERKTERLSTALCVLGSGSFETAEDLGDICFTIDVERRKYASENLIKGNEREILLALNHLAKIFFRQFLKPLSKGTFSSRLMQTIKEAEQLPKPENEFRPTLHFLKLVRWRYMQIRACSDRTDEDTLETTIDKNLGTAVTDVLYALTSRTTGVYLRTLDMVEKELAKLDKNLSEFDVPSMTVLRWDSVSLIASSTTNDSNSNWSVSRQLKRIRGYNGKSGSCSIGYMALRERSNKAKNSSKSKKPSVGKQKLIMIYKTCRDSLRNAYTYEEKKCTTLLNDEESEPENKMPKETSPSSEEDEGAESLEKLLDQFENDINQ